MSPSAEAIEEKIGKPLKEGDVLVKNHTRNLGFTIHKEYQEVVERNVVGERKILFGLLGTQTADCIKIKELTVNDFLEESETQLVRRTANRWDYMIPREERTDIPSQRER